MPFKSEAQRRFFYAAESRGDLPEGTAERWQDHTPKGKKLPERVGMSKKAFWSGFVKGAADSLGDPGAPVPAEAAEAGAVPGAQPPAAPEKLLKWNPQGGVDPRSPEEMTLAQTADLVTLPEGCPGANCGSCQFFRELDPGLQTGFCTHPEVKLDVTAQMHCSKWNAPGTYRAWEQADPSAVPDASVMQEAGALDQSLAAGGGAGPGAPGAMPPGAEGMGGPAGLGEEAIPGADGTGAPSGAGPSAAEMGGAGGPAVAEIGGPADKKPAKKDSGEKKDKDDKDEKPAGGHTINVHVNNGGEGKGKEKDKSEKKASVFFRAFES